ncbi:MAG: hypothetical protein KDD92_06440 [Caldilineaceae bacterium]|nr:hypothetical protein [Caldilineaceae bacterium]
MDILSSLDIINPLDGIFGRILHGPMHRFTFTADPGRSGLDVEMMLRQYGIRVWGREMDDSLDRALLVKRSQAVWAEYLLCRAGVSLTCPLLDPRNEHYRLQHARGTMPVPWTEDGIGAHSFVDRIVDLIDRF